MIVEDAVPVSHGGSIEVKFSSEQLGAFGQIDMEIWEKYGSKKWFTVGWYHSHPGLGCFFSSTDVFNQLFWQDKNPNGIGIVFDHKYLEQSGNLGFKTYRLNDPSKNLSSGYHEVESIVEPPDNIDYYIKIMELIRSIHSKEPPILELNETPDFFGDVTLLDQKQINYKEPALKEAEILQAIQSGISKFLELSVTPLIQYINVWSQGIVEKIVENNSRLKNELGTFKDEVSNRILKLQHSFKMSLKDILNQLDSCLDDNLDGIDKGNIDINNSFNQAKQKIVEQLDILFKEKFLDSINQILNKFNESSDLIAEINRERPFLFEKLEKHQSLLNNISEKIYLLDSSILDNFERNQKETEAKIIENINDISNYIKNLKEQTENFATPLENAFTTLESSKLSLKSKLDAIKSENETLKNKVENLNSEKKETSNQVKRNGISAPNFIK